MEWNPVTRLAVMPAAPIIRITVGEAGPRYEESMVVMCTNCAQNDGRERVTENFVSNQHE
jgi:hypothetical protein